MKKIKNSRGFTLAELLITVAIIAVLVGIFIPVFSNQLEKSREAKDLANVRNKYAELMVYVLTGETNDGSGIILKDGVYEATVKLSQKNDLWQSPLPITIAEVESESEKEGNPPTKNWVGKPKALGKCTITYSEEDGVTFYWDGIEESGNSTASFGSNDFDGYVFATWQGAGTGIKKTDSNDSWYNKTASTKKLVELDANSTYSISYTIPAEYADKTVQIGTLLFKSSDAKGSISNEMIGAQKADSYWILSNVSAKDDPLSNYQISSTNSDGSITVTQKLNTDDVHLYFGANFQTGKDFRYNPDDKETIDQVIKSIEIKKIQ